MGKLGNYNTGAQSNCAKEATMAQAQAVPGGLASKKTLVVSRVVMQRCAIGVAVVLLILGPCMTVPSWVWSEKAVNESRELNAHDLDLQLIIGGADQVTTIGETFRWWHGTWIGQVPFWRPLTSLLFWGEYRMFGPERYDLWLGVSIALQVVVSLLLIILFNRLSGTKWMGWAVALYFSAWRALPLNLGIGTGFLFASPSSLALDSPKNQPEITVAIFVLLALIGALRKQWWLVIISFVVAVCFKEMGWIALPLALVTVLWKYGSKSLREIRPVWWLALGVAVVALLVARASAGPEVFRGYHMGSNTMWVTRLVNSYADSFLSDRLFSTNVASALLGIALFTACLVRWRLWWKGLAVGVATIVVVGVQMAVHRVDPAIALAMLAENWHVSFGTLIFLIPAWALVTTEHERKSALRLAALMLLATLPFVAAGQVTQHVLYLKGVFESGIVVLAFAALIERLPRHLPHLIVR